MKKSIVFLLLSFLVACDRQEVTQETNSGDSVSVNIILSTNTIHIGDLLQATLTVDYPAGETVIIPDLGRNKHVIVRQKQRTDQDAPNGRKRTVQNYSITSLCIGEQELGPGTISYIQTNGLTNEIPFPQAKFTVISAISGTNATFLDIKGPINWPLQFPWLIIVLVLSVVLLAAIALYVRRRLRGKISSTPHIAPPTADEIAIQSLHLLKERHWIESENCEPFYTELSAIVRRYIEDQFGLHAPEETTEEFIHDAMNSRALSSAHQQLLSDFLEQSDLVKFARHRAQQQDMQNAYNAGERFVIETKQAQGDSAP